MADLTDNPTWAAGVFRLETTTPALGGAGGPMNTPLQNLADRTAYLKQEVEARLPLAGGSMSGPIALEDDGTLALHAAPRRYAAQMRFHNRLTNPHYTVDQRGNGGGVAVLHNTTTYPVDRWCAFRFNGSAISTARGYDTGRGMYYLRATVTSAAALGTNDYIVPFAQAIEGLNIADLGWGQGSAAKPIVVSFPFRASAPGTYTATIRNSAFNRVYVATFSYPSANVWQDVEIPITGEPSGSWHIGTLLGAQLFIASVSGTAAHSASPNAWGTAGLSVSGAAAWHTTNGAYVDIGPASFERGTSKSEPDFRPFAAELAMCQRYYQTLSNMTLVRWYGGGGGGINGGLLHRSYATVMRALPSAVLTYQSGNYHDPVVNATGDALQIWFNSGTNVGDNALYTATLNAELM